MLEELDTMKLFVVVAFSIAIILWISYEIIKAATRSGKVLNEQLKQTNLLKEIARIQGVPEQTIEECTKEEET
jgi:hypothetical protein